MEGAPLEGKTVVCCVAHGCSGMRCVDAVVVVASVVVEVVVMVR